MRKKKRKDIGIVKISLITLTSIILIYYSILGLTRLNYMIGEDLVFSINPPNVALSLFHNESDDVLFHITTNNEWFCDAICDYSISDLSLNATVDSGSMVIPPTKGWSRTFSISAPLSGEGQWLYSFESTCYNQKSFLCRSPGIPTTRSSFISVTYGPSDEERKKINQTAKSIQNFLERLAVVDTKINQIIGSLADAQVIKNDIKPDTITLRKLKDQAIELHNLWSEERYMEVNVEFSLLEQLEKETELDYNSTLGLEEFHNESIVRLNKLSSPLDDAYITAYIMYNITHAKSASQLAMKINSIITGFYDYPDYSFLLKEISNVEKAKTILDTNTEYEKKKIVKLAEQSILMHDDFLCKAKDSCSQSHVNFCEDVLGFKSRFDSADTAYANSIYRKYLNNNLSTNPKEKVLEYFGLENWTEYNTYVQALTASIITNDDYPSLDNTAIENLSQEQQLDILRLGISYPKSMEVSFRFCQRLVENHSLDDIASAMNIQIPEIIKPNIPLFNLVIPNYISDVETTLFEHKPQCCVFSICKPCCSQNECINDPSSFPVIFIHGHAFNKGTSPDYSLQIFEPMQKLMESDGFINAGFLSLETDIEAIGKGTWGLSGLPIMVKATYYYDVYSEDGKYTAVPQNSESIDVYALRLREIIDNIKFISGRPRVNIIAHSMGGLVARRYIQIFGEQSVDKLIMIATPNQGVEGSIESFCPVLGESKECRDMSKDSVFLKKLNDPKRQPLLLDMTTIAGVGCNMDSGTGDGIVRAKDVALPNAANHVVEGVCNSAGSLHGDLLKVDEYPETYQIVKLALLS